MQNEDIISDIWQRSHYIGNILFHLESVRNDEDQWSFFLIPMLSIILEKALKMYISSIEDDMDIFDESFARLIKKVYSMKVIDDSEFSIMNELRLARNDYFHWLEYNDWIVINWKISFYTEADTHQYLYDYFSNKVLLLILKFLK